MEIQKKKNKKSIVYKAVVSYTDDSGKRRRKTKTFKRKKDARDWGAQTELDIRKGLKIADNISFSDYFKNWYETYKKGVAAVTKNKYRAHLRAIAGYFKDTPIQDITRSDYQQFINWFGGNHAPATVQEILTSNRACVASALYDGIIKKDFTFRIQPTANANKKRKVDYPNSKEIKALATITKQNLDPIFTSRYMILTALYTGARLSEIQGLTWKDIDFLHGEISINKSWNDVKKEFKPTKNESSNRTIKVSRSLLNIISQLKANKSTMVFLGGYGGVPTSNAVNKTLKKLLKQAGINRQGFTFHGLRHAHVAYLIAHGVDIYAISKRLGHSNVSTTLNVYSYLVDEYQKKNDEKIVKITENL